MDWKKRDGSNNWSDVATMFTDVFSPNRATRQSHCIGMSNVKWGEPRKAPMSSRTKRAPDLALSTSLRLHSGPPRDLLAEKSRQRCCEGRRGTTAGDMGHYTCETQIKELLACLSLCSALRMGENLNRSRGCPQLCRVRVVGGMIHELGLFKKLQGSTG